MSPEVKLRLRPEDLDSVFKAVSQVEPSEHLDGFSHENSATSHISTIVGDAVDELMETLGSEIKELFENA